MTHPLADDWNTAGRAFYTEFSERLVRMNQGEKVELDVEDPRTTEQGEAVLGAALELQSAGKSEAIREQFDAAYTPFFELIKKTNRSLGFVTILGPDEVLVRRGSPWQKDAVTLHLYGNDSSEVDDVLGVCRSDNREQMVVARAAGLEFHGRGGVAALAGAPQASLAWPAWQDLSPRWLVEGQSWAVPEGAPHVEQLAVSDDGMRAVVSCYRQAILLASRHADEPDWRLLWPDARPEHQGWEPDDDVEWHTGDMTHVAISADGTRLALGCQDSAHVLLQIEDGEVVPYATVGPLSEYPHFACFSGDGEHTALNSCHFYNGATISFGWKGNRGLTLPGYEQHEQAPLLDGSLRVYAARWLDRGVAQALVGNDAKAQGLFLLAGNGIMRGYGATGGLGFVQGFGSSAGSMDFCPETRRIAVASYSGMVHLYDSDQDELPGRIDGDRPRRELIRWLTWEHLPNGPLRW